jgi:hypothetical protein
MYPVAFFDALRVKSEDLVLGAGAHVCVIGKRRNSRR